MPQQTLLTFPAVFGGNNVIKRPADPAPSTSPTEMDIAIDSLAAIISEIPLLSSDSLVERLSSLSAQLSSVRDGFRPSKRTATGFTPSPSSSSPSLFSGPAAALAFIEAQYWVAPSPVVPLSLVRAARSVNTKTYIFTQVWQRFEALYRVAPHHDLFGNCESGRIRAPFRLPGGKGAATSWWLRTNSLADSIAKRMGTQITPGSCWILDRQDTSIQRKDPDAHKAVTLANYKHHRLLAFLRSGTEQSWSDFRSGVPVLHFCHNGFSKGRREGCVNGVEHGLFGTALENNAQRGCAGLDRQRCPGHMGEKCLYVWLSGENLGVPRPCLNMVNRPELCAHEKKCF